jgi:hypothetical protein
MRHRPLAAAAVLACASASLALTLVPLSEAEIVDASERIVLGTVTSVTVEWADPDGDGLRNIYTTATFRVEDSLKGGDQVGDSLTLRLFGGTLEGRTQAVPGLPTFTQNERLVLCLLPRAGQRKAYPIVGAIQGRWVVTRDESGQDEAHREIDGADWVGPDGGPLDPRDLPRTAREPLADLLARLRAEVAR